VFIGTYLTFQIIIQYGLQIEPTIRKHFILKISILTPSYNSADSIERAILSVLAQKYDDVEHIVVDGGSSDGTIDVLYKYSHLNWISEPDDGQVNALNKAFNLSSGDIIGVLNSDDYYLDNAFSTVLPLFLKGKKMVMGQVQVRDELHNTVWFNDPKIEFADMLMHWAPNAFCVNPVGYFYRREVQEKIPFNPEYGNKHDLAFLLEAAAQFNISKVDRGLGVFNHSTISKTTQDQLDLDYWKNENFPFIDRLLQRMPESYQINFRVEQEKGYRLRKEWTMSDIASTQCIGQNKWKNCLSNIKKRINTARNKLSSIFTKSDASSKDIP